MSVHVREIYPGKWYLRITYRGIRMTKAVGSKERAFELKKKLTTALELYGLDALRVLEEDQGKRTDSQEVRAGRSLLSTSTRHEVAGRTRKDGPEEVHKESYTYLLTKHVVPAFGTERLDTLDYSKLKAWVIEQAGKYSKDSVRLMVAVLRTMLQEAVNEGILSGESRS